MAPPCKKMFKNSFNKGKLQVLIFFYVKLIPFNLQEKPEMKNLSLFVVLILIIITIITGCFSRVKSPKNNKSEYEQSF
jgi:uncharacterized membrane protein